MQTEIIYNEDCIQGMRKIPDKSVDLIVTDPPYLIGYHTNHRKEGHRFRDEILNDHNEELIKNYIKECFRILKDDTAMYMFCSAKTLPFFMNESESAGFKIKNTIIWDKGNWTAGDLEAQYGQAYEPLLYLNKGRRIILGKRFCDIWRFPRVASEKLVHQNQKPVNIIRQCIQKSANIGDLIFDGFMGSGTTAVAAIQEKCHFLGFELDKEYFDVATKRVKNEKSILTLW